MATFAQDFQFFSIKAISFSSNLIKSLLSNKVKQKHFRWWAISAQLPDVSELFLSNPSTKPYTQELINQSINQLIEGGEGMPRKVENLHTVHNSLPYSSVNIHWQTKSEIRIWGHMNFKIFCNSSGPLTISLF